MDGYIEFSFRLPTCLYLKDGHQFEFKNEGSFVKISDVIQQMDARYGTATNMEVASDIDGGFHYTDLHIFVKDDDPRISEDSLERVHGKKVVSIANKLIDAFRYLADRPSIANVKDLESVGNFGITRHREKLPAKGMMSINFGVGGSLRAPPNPHSVEFHTRLQSFFDGESVPLERYFLMDARRHVALGHGLQGLVSAVTALEISITGYPSPVWWKFIRIFKRGERLAVVVRQRLSGRLSEQDLSNVSAAIKERNQVVHRGKRTLKGEAEQYVRSITVAVDNLCQ